MLSCQTKVRFSFWKTNLFSLQEILFSCPCFSFVGRLFGVRRLNTSSVPTNRSSAGQTAENSAFDPDPSQTKSLDGAGDDRLGFGNWTLDLGDEDIQSLFSWSAISQRWQDNRGNWFLLATAGILAVGSLVMVFTPDPAADPNQLAIGGIGEENQLNPGSAGSEEQGEEATTDPPNSADGSSETAINARSPDDAAMIRIEVIGGMTDGGQLRIAIYDRADGFNEPEKAMLKTVIPPDQQGIAVWEIPFNDLPERFAVAAYHDGNGDATLNRSGFGIPIERYGFSNNARGVIGPPGFADAVVSRPDPDEPIQVVVR